MTRDIEHSVKFADLLANKPVIPIRLIGQNGNAYNLMGVFRKAATKAGWISKDIAVVLEEAKSSDYNHLVRTLSSFTLDGKEKK